MHLGVEFARCVQIVVVGSKPAKDRTSALEGTMSTPMDTYASLSCLACSGLSIPSVVQTSMSILRTSVTISRIRWNPRLRPAKSRHAAPMQNRVLPFALALRAASMTGSTCRSGEAVVGVE